MANTLMIEAHGLRKRFGTTVALDGVDLEVPAGTILSVLGPNGAGKTTAVRILTTLALPDDGSARVAGHDVVTEANEVQRNIGVTAQDATIDEVLTGRENLTLIGRLSGLRRSEARARAKELLDQFELTDAADRVLKGYSGGMRRRLDLAAGLVTRPPVLFLDEPTTGLDPQNRANLWEHVRRLQERGATVFLTTHYLEEADNLCDRVMIIDHGVIVAQGSPRDLKRDVIGDSVVLRVADGDHSGERARDLLAAAPFVSEVSPAGDGELRCYVDDGAAALPEILRLLDGAQIALRQISLSEPTLDDVFLAKTGRSLRDAGPATEAEVAQ
jgi:ABC-2 type transport system ATP-binding protein